MNLKNKTILITGGTGTFGQVMVKSLLKIRGIKKIIIYSRDEFKQQQMRKKIDSKILRYFIGDIRDKSRLTIATIGVDLIIHAAALKHVDVAEYNPTEFVETNIFGAKNLIEVCSQNKIKKVVALSTDKASSPINLYGATKLCSDKLFIAANNYIVGTIFSVVRYGNVEGSRGSVIPFFKSLANTNIFPVTSKEMTRFSLSADEAIKMVFWVIKHSIGQEVVVPKTASYRILDLVNAFSRKPKIKIIGIRPGEKLHEQMISAEDSRYTYEYKNYYKILPAIFNIYKNKKYIKDGKKVGLNFEYSSNTNTKWLTKSDLRKWLKKYSDNIL